MRIRTEVAEVAGRRRMVDWFRGLLAVAALGYGCSHPPAPAAVAPGPASASAPTATPATPTPTDLAAASPAAAVPAPTAPPAPDQTAAGASSASANAAAEAAPAGCETVEVTGAPPGEALCTRPRKVVPADACCEDPVEVFILSGKRVLLRVDACGFVPPQCAHSHGHGRMDARLRVLAGPPPEVIVVEGGCESRAIMHGYVPPGVAAWTGCRHVRYRWDGKALVKQ